ncbi:MAG TPA: S53 family peptidase, partial [Planctomycetaceae bacterium]
SQFGLTSNGPSLYDQYGGAGSFLTVLNQGGQTTSLPGTDPAGAGQDNWEVEEALDVEWTHAVAPGAKIIVVEANSQSLPDLMAAVAMASARPGVSVVSMSWGFAESQTITSAEEAQYDQYFTTPGVTYVASSGDYGAANAVYPAFSPNVLAVGGTTLSVNADNSYAGETGWGGVSSTTGTFVGSGGGISQYESEPGYQQGVQSTGGRTTPDVAFVADSSTGVWVADPYNLDPSNPWEPVGGTSLSAPTWAGLIAIVNQGRASAGQPVLNSSSPTETQQDLYALSQKDYNPITSGNNGYNAGAGYNMVTGLGSPVANLLIPDLIAGNFPASGQVAPISAADLVYTPTGGGSSNGGAQVLNVFAAVTVSAGASSADSPGMQIGAFSNDSGSPESQLAETGETATGSAAQPQTVATVREGASSPRIGYVFGTFDDNGRLMTSGQADADLKFVASADGNLSGVTVQSANDEELTKARSRDTVESSLDATELPNAGIDPSSATAANGSATQLFAGRLGKSPLDSDPT